jgi:hypothetical protein
VKQPHTCKPSEPYCCCSINGLEPSWDCPIHGGALINRCDCGRFVRAKAYFVEPEWAWEDVVDSGGPGDPGLERDR